MNIKVTMPLINWLPNFANGLCGVGVHEETPTFFLHSTFCVCVCELKPPKQANKIASVYVLGTINRF